MGAGVEPGESVAKFLDLELSFCKEYLVDGGDLQFTPCRRLDLACHFYNLVGIEIQTGHGIVALWLGRLFLDAQAVAIGVELGHAVSLRVADPVTEDGRLPLILGCGYGFPELGIEA